MPQILNASVILYSCAFNFFALSMLKAKGLSSELLSIIYKATVLSKLSYASQLWWGFLAESDKDRLEAFLRRASRCSFYDGSSIFCELAKAADTKLFSTVLSSHNHMLFPLLPPTKNPFFVRLRPRPHSFSLPDKSSSLVAKNFLIRMLYLNTYWLARFNYTFTYVAVNVRVGL